jgi:8-oxo-dGTP diphosphatase
MNKIIHVAAGVIVNAKGEILIAKRLADSHQGGLWEFPGGKLEAGETAEQALIRELNEELGIVATSLEPLIQIRHDYSDKSVLLDVLRVTEFEGEAYGKEGQPIRWVSAKSLNDFEFPAANVPIVSAAQLPNVMLITDDETSVESCLNKVEAALDRGAKLIQLRQRLWDCDQWQQAVPKLISLCQSVGALLLLNCPKGNVCADGWHLTSQQLMAAELPTKVSSAQWLSAACHNPQELAQAEALGIDFVTLSPVEPTSSHPDVIGLGWELFEDWVSCAKLPVYALGGMSDHHLNRALNTGAQGVAGIRAWWL